MSTETGRSAESLAAEYLQSQGLKIIDRNWRNRWCEIDLVAKSREGVVHFVEVKYRRTDAAGSGFDYITSNKISRLQRAATMWMTFTRQDLPFQIDIIAVSGSLKTPQIDYVPNAIT